MYNALAKRIEKGFATAFDMQPLLVFSPGRINLIGEHIDYNEGFVFPAAIDKGIVVALEKSNTSETTIIAADFEESFHLDLDNFCLLYTSPSPRDAHESRMPSSA